MFYMNGEKVEDWIAKAEENYIVALREYRHVKRPAYYTVCFNAQQCIEKYLKAFLVKHKRDFRKTHELGELCYRCVQIVYCAPNLGH